MFTIAQLTYQRFKEPAFIFLFGMGCLISYLVAGSQGFEISLIDSTDLGSHHSSLLFGSFILLLLSIIISIFVGSTEIPRDLTTKVINIFLSKPITRRQYLFGKFLGTFILCSGLYSCWVFTMMIFHYIKQPSEGLMLTRFLMQYIYILCLLPFCAVATTISCYLDDISSMIVTCLVIIFGFSMFTVPLLVAAMPAEAGKMLLLFYYCIPNFSFLFSNIQSVIHCIALAIYSLTITIIFLKIGLVHFEEKDLI